MPLTYRFRWISLIAASLLALAAGAHAADGFYFAGYMGLNIPQKKNAGAQGTTAPFAGAIGLKLAPHWRMESEMSYRGDDLDRVSFGQEGSPLDGRFKSWSGLVNVYYDFDAPGKLEPFVGFGAGYQENYAGTGGGFAWQMGGGVNYSFTPALSFSSAYRFTDNADFEFGSSDENDSHEVRVGVTYKLPVKPRKHARGLNMMTNE
jgi:opacity protein-like surface antigen